MWNTGVKSTLDTNTKFPVNLIVLQPVRILASQHHWALVSLGWHGASDSQFLLPKTGSYLQHAAVCRWKSQLKSREKTFF